MGTRFVVSILSFLKCVGSFLILSLRSRRLEVVGERENGHARLLLARPFFLVPATSKRLLRRLSHTVPHGLFRERTSGARVWQWVTTDQTWCK